MSAHFSLTQFQRVITEGILSLLEFQLKADLINAYRVMARANNQIDAIAIARSGDPQAHAINNAQARLGEARPLITTALDRLSETLGKER